MPSSSSKLPIRIVSIGLAAAVGLFLAMIIVYNFANRGPADERELRAIMSAMDRSLWDMQKEIQSGGTQSAATTAPAKNKARVNDLAERCLSLAEAYPNSPSALGALFVAVSRSSDSSNGRKAAAILADRIPRAELAHIAGAIMAARGVSNAPELAPLLLDRVKQDPSNQAAAELLISVCSMAAAPLDADEPSPEFQEAADLIMAQHAGSTKIGGFCEHIGSVYQSARWGREFEPHLRTILDQNQDRQVRCAALFALASVVDSAGDRKTESHQLYSRFVTEFDGQHAYPYQQIELMLNEQAKIHLE